MASTDLHKLVVKLEAESSKLHSALENSDNRLKRFERKTGTALKKVKRHFSSLDKTVQMFSGGLAGLASGAALGGLAMLTTKSLETADAIDKATRRTNLSARAYQELSFVASQSSISQETFSMAMQRFTRRTAEAARGSGEAKGALESLGIQLTDNEGKIRTSDALLSDVADALKNVEDPAERVRLSFKLFDSEGVKMVNMLANGSAGMNSLREEANRLGLVLDDQLIANAVQANDQLDKVSKIAGVHLTRAMLDLAPALITAARGFAEVARYAGETLDKFKDIENRTFLEPLRAEMNALLDERLDILARLESKNALYRRARLKDQRDLLAIEKRINEINERMLEIQKQRAPSKPAQATDNVIDLPKLGTGGSQEAIEKFGSSIKTDAEVVDFFSAKVAILNEKFNNGTMSVARYAAEIEKLKPSLKGIGDQEAERRDVQRSELDKKLEAIKAYGYSREEALAASYSIEAEMAAIAFEDDAMRKEALLALEEKYQLDKSRLAKEGLSEREAFERAHWSAKALIVSGAMRGLSSLLMTGNKEQQKIGKHFARLSIATSTAVGIMKAYEQLGPLWGTAAAVGIAAEGAAQLINMNAGSLGSSSGVPQTSIASNDPTQSTISPISNWPSSGGGTTYIERPEYIEGGMMTSEVFEWYMDRLEDAIERKDRVIFTRNSYQGLELTA